MIRISAFVSCLFSLIAADASAQSLDLQLRYEPFTLRQGAGGDLSLFNDSGVAVGVSVDRLVARMALGVRRDSINSDSREAVGADSQQVETTDRLTVITPMVHVQYYLADAVSGALAPFIVAKIGKSFASITAEEKGQDCVGGSCTSFPDLSNQTAFDKEIDEAARQADEDELSPWLFVLGAGAEYFASEHLSVGIESGLRVLHASSQIDVSADDGGTTHSVKDESSATNLEIFYALLTIGLHW